MGVGGAEISLISCGIRSSCACVLWGGILGDGFVALVQLLIRFFRPCFSDQGLAFSWQIERVLPLWLSLLLENTNKGLEFSGTNPIPISQNSNSVLGFWLLRVAISISLFCCFLSPR